jgi:hypothetical protein
VTEGIKRAEEHLRLRVEDARERHAFAAAVYERGHKAAVKMKGDDERARAFNALVRPGDPPPNPDLVTNDVTPQGLGKALEKGPNAQIMMTAEAGVFLGGFAMTKETQIYTMTCMNDNWDGKDRKSRRADKERNTDIVGKAVCVCLAGQPIVVRRLTGSRLAKDTGFLSRFMITEPPSKIGTRFLDGKLLRNEASTLFFNDRIFTLLIDAMPVEHLLGLPRRRLRMDGLATWSFRDFANEMERGMTAGGVHASIAGFANKAAEHAARFAACFAVFNGRSEIDRATLLDAIELTRFYLGEMMRLSGLAAPTEIETDAHELLVWLRTKWGEEYFSPSDAVRGPTCVRSFEPRRQAIEHLVLSGNIERVAPRAIKGRHRREVYRVLPAEGDTDDADDA